MSKAAHPCDYCGIPTRHGFLMGRARICRQDCPPPRMPRGATKRPNNFVSRMNADKENSDGFGRKSKVMVHRP